MTDKGVMVITGASKGVGKATALRFAQEGYVVCALARGLDKLEQLAAENDRIFPYKIDISDSEQVWQVFGQIVADHGRVDVLVNNAGGVPGPNSVDAALIDKIIDVNLKGTMYCTYAVLPTMREQGGGHIINVASISGVDIQPEGNDGLYAASKYGVVAFGESVGKRFRHDGVLVSSLCPGGIDTPLWNENNPYPFDKDTMIRPEEVADLIAYILKQPKRTLFKNVIFVPTIEQW